MGFLDKLPFAKKKDDLALPNFNDPALGQSYNSPQDPLLVQPSQSYGSPPSYPYPQGNPIYPQQNTSPLYPQPGVDQMSSINMGRDIEVLRAKIDAVQATLDSLNQRFASIERYINESTKRRW
ncbi:MAG: hypothetical protein EPN86_05620 [Nanoarchaeota archaeon]|nr:MAG: hypothetical protein EPN86_05620 [Nanoarchaeota archaeon]